MPANNPSAATPWLSLLIPVYNVSAYIEDCLMSVLPQMDDGVEVLLLDDVGSDDSWEIVERIAQQHPLRLLRHANNGGLSAARNSLLAQARGDYVWFLDSDDILLPGAINTLRAGVANGAPDLLLCDYRVLRDHSGLRHRLRGEAHRRTLSGPSQRTLDDRNALITGLLHSRQLHTWSKIARRTLWQQAPFPEGRYFEDMAVIPALLANCTRWQHLPKPLVGYRQRGDSILATMTPRKTSDLLASLRDLHIGLTQIPGGLNSSAAAALQYFCLRAFANLARVLPKNDATLEADCRRTMAALFPTGIQQALADCRQHGWWLRAWRMQRSLAKRGWL